MPMRVLKPILAPVELSSIASPRQPDRILAIPEIDSQSNINQPVKLLMTPVKQDATHAYRVNEEC